MILSLHTCPTLLQAIGRTVEATNLASRFEGRVARQMKIVEIKVQQERERHELRADEFLAKILSQISTGSVQIQRVTPETFQLGKLTTSYTISDMVKTLVERERRVTAALDVGARLKVLSKLQAVPLRERMVKEFYGEDFCFVPSVTYAPRNRGRAVQDIAVEHAIKMGWVQRKPPPPQQC